MPTTKQSNVCWSYRLEEAMKNLKLSKSAFDERIGTSRLALDRLLDPDNESVSLETRKKPLTLQGGDWKFD